MASNNPFDGMNEGYGRPGTRPPKLGPRPVPGSIDGPQNPPGSANGPFVRGAYGDTGTQQLQNSNLLRFIQRMMDGLDPNDPAVQQLTNQVFNASQRAASNRGIGGPLAVANTGQAVSYALNDAQNQRYQLGLQALGAFNQGKYEDARTQLAQQDQAFRQAQQLAQQQYAQGAAQGQSIGSGIGAGLGAAAGALIPGAQPFIPALMAGGSQLGGGIGSQIGGAGAGYGSNNYGGVRPYSYSPSTYSGNY